MMLAVTSYLVGGVSGYLLVLMLLSGESQVALLNWASDNLGLSIWAFGICLASFLATLHRLQSKLSDTANYRSVVQLDQLSDVWIHVFIGIGVVWTAIGMRSALVDTLSAPQALGNDAGQVLERLVDGGILLALSTTIVGAVGGYLMRLVKTVSIGGQLTDFYHRHERLDWERALSRLESIEHHLAVLDQGRTRELA